MRSGGRRAQGEALAHPAGLPASAWPSLKKLLIRRPLQVSNGVVGSAAFAAYDAGFDVWLANSRSNAPRLHTGKPHQRQSV